jgi:asparagine synthase (glutamine-hydrolysing)
VCGIVAIISKDAPLPSNKLIINMRDLLSHRGPDDSGIWSNNNIQIGFRRLSIQDPSPNGHQPMINETGRYVIVFNGEIYNFKILRDELRTLGASFSSGTDTEVVLHAFHYWGPSCVEKFTGMFAFIIVDTKNNTVFVARDHLGIKPLYTHETNAFIYFSSEIKAFAPISHLELNEKTVYEQILFRYVSGKSTPIKNVNKFLPGSWTFYKNGKPFKNHVYYSIHKSLQRQGKMTSPSLEEIESQLNESIILHTESDVGYTVQLSGGVDSSYVTGIVSSLKPNLQTYSIALNHDKYDESVYQKLISNKFKTNHFELNLDGNKFNDAIETASWHMDVPIVHLGCVFLMLLCKEISKSSKVVITGEGADELFGGYSRYSLQKLIYLSNYLKRLGLKGDFLPNLPIIRVLKTQLQTHDIFSQLTMNTKVMEGLLSSDLHADLSYRQATMENLHHPIDKLLAHDQACYLSSLLDRQDKMSMAASVESRVPFCNPHLFEMVNPISPNKKIYKRTPKYLFKKIAENILPTDVIYRRKIGLTLPIDDWLRKGGALHERLTYLTDETFKNRGLYNSKQIENLINQHISKKCNAGKYLMSILMFEIWIRTFFDRSHEIFNKLNARAIS